MNSANNSSTMLLVLLLFIILPVIGGANDGLGASFIFGDSLVDAGNNNYLPTLSKANIPPNGIDFKASSGNPTGHYTNGRTSGDIVNRLSMDIQIDYFNITRKQLNGLLGPSKAREFFKKKSIFSITVRSNDFLNNYLLLVFSIEARIFESPDAFIDDLLNHLRGQLTFVIGNVGPIGCIPYQRTINQINQDQCVDLPNKLAVQYNKRLKDLLTELNENLPGSTIVLANVYDLVIEVIKNYAKYGFATASKACCRNGGQFAGIIPCGPTSSMCQDRSKYVLRDPYHPSEAANLIIAKQLIDGDTKYISPMNLRQLRDL